MKVYRKLRVVMFLLALLCGLSVFGQVQAKAEQQTVTYDELSGTLDRDSVEPGFKFKIVNLQSELGIEKVRVIVRNSSERNVYSEYLTSTTGDYSGEIKFKDLKYVYGTYTLELRITTGDQKRMTINEKLLIDMTRTDGKVEGSLSADQSKLRMVIRGVKVPGNYKQMRFHVFDSSNTRVYYKDGIYDKKTGEWAIEVPTSRLKNLKAATYQLKAVGDTQWGKRKVFEGNTITVLPVKGSVSGKAPNNTEGNFTFEVSALSKSEFVKSVDLKVIVGNKSKTYKNLKKESNGTYLKKIKASDFGYRFGTYRAEVTVKQKNGITSMIAYTHYSFSPKNFVRIGPTDQNKAKPVYVYNPTEISNPIVEIWSKAGNKADLVTYKGEYHKDTNNLWFNINCKGLSFPGVAYGTVKVSSGKGTKVIANFSFDVKKEELGKNGWFYEKSDDGKTYKYYYEDGERLTNLTSILGIKSAQKLYIEVNRQQNVVTVYAKDPKTNTFIIPVQAFTCSVGLPSTPTPLGTYKTDRNHRWKLLMGPSYGQYATHIVDGIYFHSVAGRDMTSHNLSSYAYNKLGQAASHGCIRLTVRDAKWIYDYCAIGTTVKIMDSSSKGPLGKPETIKVPAGCDYDPTDPVIIEELKNKDKK